MVAKVSNLKFGEGGGGKEEERKKKGRDRSRSTFLMKYLKSEDHYLDAIT